MPDSDAGGHYTLVAAWPNLVADGSETATDAAGLIATCDRRRLLHHLATVAVGAMTDYYAVDTLENNAPARPSGTTVMRSDLAAFRR